MIWLKQSLESPEVFGWEELCKKPQWLVCVGGSTEGRPVAASSWCGGWRFAALRRICGSIPSGVIRGTQMKCSGKALSLTAAMCVCLFSFTSRPLHLLLTILDLIIRYDAKVKIHSCCDGRDIVQQLEHYVWLWLALDGVIDPATTRVTTLCSLSSQTSFSSVLLSLIKCFTCSGGRSIQTLYLVKAVHFKF